MPNPEEFVIDGSHFGGILKAMDRVLYSNYRATDTEIVCNGETEEYTVRLCGTHEIIATIPY